MTRFEHFDTLELTCMLTSLHMVRDMEDVPKPGESTLFDAVDLLFKELKEELASRSDEQVSEALKKAL